MRIPTQIVSKNTYSRANDAPAGRRDKYAKGRLYVRPDRSARCELDRHLQLQHVSFLSTVAAL